MASRFPFIAAYYWMTPLFWAADVLFDANFRVAGLEGHPFWKAAYYLFTMGCGVAIVFRPGWTRGVALTESTINILLVLLGLLLPYYQLVNELAARSAEVDTSAFAFERIANLLLSGMVWMFAFYWNLRPEIPRRALR